MRPADIVTLANALAGLAAIVAAWAGDLGLAVHIIFLGIIIDGADGAVARLGHGGGPLGHVIDTLADVVTFVVAPAAILPMAFGIDAWTLGAAAAFVAAGVLRLARFQNLPGGAAHFFGLSTPGAALMLGTMILLGVSLQTAAATAAVAAIGMLLRWPLPKLRGPIGVAAALVILANLALYMMDHAWHAYSLWGQLGFLILYLVAGPAYLKARTGVGGN